MLRRTRTLTTALSVAAALATSCSKSDSPTSPSGASNGAPVSVSYAGGAAYSLGARVEAGTINLTVTTSAPVLALRMPGVGAGTGAPTVTGTFTSPSGTISLSGTVSGSTVSVQGGGLTFGGTTSSDGSLSGVGIVGGQQYTVAAYKVTPISYPPADYWGSYKSRYFCLNPNCRPEDSESHSALVQLTIGGTSIDGFGSYPVHMWGWDPTSPNSATKPDAIEFTGTIHLSYDERPDRMLGPNALQDVRTRYLDPQIMPMTVAGGYFPDSGWLGTFDGRDQYGKADGNWTAHNRPGTEGLSLAIDSLRR